MRVDAMKMAEQEQAARQSDRQRVSMALPAHMMALLLDEAEKIGWSMRADVRHRLNNAAAVPLAGLDNLSIQRLAKKIDDAATTLLRDVGVVDPVDMLHTVAMLCMVLIDEGYLQDRRNMAVLVSLLLLEDAKDESKDSNGELSQFKLNEPKWREGAKRLLHRGILLGLFERPLN